MKLLVGSALPEPEMSTPAKATSAAIVELREIMVFILLIADQGAAVLAA
jgi:hypothetical protein